MSLHQFLYSRIYKPFLKQYLKFDTVANIDGMRIKVLRGVFHPNLFFSTPYLFDYLKSQELTNCRFLEIGSGSGVLSILAYKKGAIVTAIDIDKNALENTRLNFFYHFGESHKAVIYESDLFKNLHPQKFDRILINPPYFFKKVESEWQQAWYCGAEGEYFRDLFAGMVNFIHPQSEITMILADNCDIDRIKNIALKHNFYFLLIQQKKIKWEMNFIFKIRYQSSQD